MLIWNPSKLTTKGKALLAKAQAGRCTIKITKAQTGSGQYSSGEATDARTSLKAPVQTLPIHSKEIQNGSTLVLKVAITNKTSDTDVLKSGYEIREFGIFAQDPDDGEILYSIATASTSDYMPAYNGVIPSVISMSYYLEVANASSVTIVTAGGLALQSDLEALADRVTIIEQAAVKKYGARKKVGQQSCGAESWERLGGAVGLTAKAAVGTGDVQNDFMKSVYPYNACRPCNLSEDRKVTAYLGDANFSWTGDNGDVMLEMPLCYTSRYFETDSDGVEWEYRWVSSAPVDGLHVNPAFTDGSSISDKIYIPIFNGSAGKDAATGAKDVIRSIAGATPLTEVTRATFRTRSRNKGEGWQLDDVWNMFLLDHLFIIMFAGTPGAENPRIRTYRIQREWRRQGPESQDRNQLHHNRKRQSCAVLRRPADRHRNSTLESFSIMGQNDHGIQGVNRGGSSDRNLLRRRSGEYRSRKCNLVMRSEDR